MVSRTSYERMSAHDASYLTRETATQPLHYALQIDVDGRLDFDAVRDSLAQRLDALPGAHRRPRYPLLAGRPVWVDDPDFDVARHITAWPSELRDDEDVAAVFSELTMRRLPRDRPLWNLTVAAGPGDRTTMWLRVHHAMMDGALVRVMLNSLFPARAADTGPPWRPVRPPTRLWLLLLVLLRRLQRVVSRGASEQPPASGAPPEALPTTMTGPVSGERAIAATTVDLQAVKAARKQTGATVNDLFLAVATEALRGYLDPLPATVLALVPRNIRTEDDASAVGNRAWSMLVPLPTGDDDPAVRLAKIRTATEAGKATDSTSGTQGWRFDIALTNVPFGGPFALLDRPVIGMRASVPLQGHNRMVGTCTTQSDALTITYTADGAAYPDVERLAALTQRAWQRLFREGAA